MPDNTDLVTLTIDGVKVTTKKGTNLIEAAKLAGVDVPYYCYHPHLSIAGNCRMCQVQVEGQPKLTIACNTTVSEGMVVKTQKSSPDVSEAQRATLEFLLINHPLDCTVCDQAGHCKLQDYYYEYNGKASRFIEEKVHKVKAEPLGPDVIYDGERCIVCTRCVRFCEEVTKTSELGVFNRGDHAVIGINPGDELDNPLAGTVVDLCPVGALTHRRWRFNTRIWYTDQHQSICPGCATGCNVELAVRDDKVVHVKARLNSTVNKEWLCDEGRYGFDRFQPNKRLTTPLLRQGEEFVSVEWDKALLEATKLKGSTAATDAAMFLSPLLTLEEIWFALEFAQQVMRIQPGSGLISMQLSARELSEAEAVLVSPDYAPNARGANIFGIGSLDHTWRETTERGYQQLLAKVRAGQIKRVLFVGEGSILEKDLDSALQGAIGKCEISVALTPRALEDEIVGPWASQVQRLCNVVLPSWTINEKTGVMVNKDLRFQRIKAGLVAPFGSFAEWLLLKRIAEANKQSLIPAQVMDERGLFRQMADKVDLLKELSLIKIGDLGISLEELPGNTLGVGKEAGNLAG